ncbi:MAG: hypothetical protein AAGJ83_07765, partial [Planctomycetota bacterium]
FDPSRNEPQRKTLDGITVNVAPAFDSTNADAVSGDSQLPQQGRSPLFIGSIFFAATLAIAILFRSAVARSITRFRDGVSSSEWMEFQRFITAARSGDPKRTLRKLTQWADKLQDASPAPLLSDIFSKFGDERARRQLEVLYGSLESESVDFDDLIHACRSIRREALRSRKSNVARNEVLPPMRAPVAQAHPSADMSDHRNR